ncbi:hypothetical protein KF728_29145 [Candidatus Obscuribacterales bacterium]|nr:hypothetical protein [Candidatus Obscuribacterales bacterium]
MTINFMIIAAPDCPRGYFGQLPEHNPERAEGLLDLLGWTLNERKSASIGLESAKAIGAYEMAYILVDQTSVGLALRARSHSVLPKALDIHPQGTVFLMHSHDSSNSFHYALYQAGNLVREHSGDIDGLSKFEFGEPVDEELEHYARSKIEDGERKFYIEMMYRNRPQLEEFTVDEFGEHLGLGIASRFFGEVDSTNYPQCLKGDKLMGELFY